MKKILGMLLGVSLSFSAFAHWGEILPNDVETLTKLAENGNATAQISIGKKYFFGLNVPKDKELGLYWIKKSAMQGNAEAEFTFSQRFEPDSPNEIIWLQKSANHHYPLAEIFLGNRYYYGGGVLQDYSKAFYWYKQSGNASNQLAPMYYEGKGVQKNEKLAKKLLLEACENRISDKKSCELYQKIEKQESLDSKKVSR